MNEILDQIRAAGFSQLTTPVFDGKIHRFKLDNRDTRESGWYCGFQNFTKTSGEAFYVIQVGSWRDVEKFTFKTDANYSREDLESIKKEIEKVKRKADAERRAHQEKVAVECERKWKDLHETTALVAYAEKKKIKEHYGSRVDTVTGTLFVPMRDSDGKLWSLQRIQSDGGKYFESGGRVQGTFHTIGDIASTDTIYVAEGFATAASIFEALRRPVVVAFNAANIVAVAQALKMKYPDKAFVICGDNDQWTKKPDGTLWNPGRDRAEEAAKKTMGLAVFPDFSDLDGRPTDFNDLAVREGLDAVREQISKATPEKHWIMPLGYDASTYYFLSNVNPQIQAISSGAMSALNFFRLQPLEYWETLYPATGNSKEGVSWSRAANDLMSKCHARGIFRPDHVRGRGVWRDGHRFVYHMGDRLYFDGRTHDLHRNILNSKFIYEKDDSMPLPHATPLDRSECEALLDALYLVNFDKPHFHQLLAGWLVTAPVCGALAWRSHVWLTGASGSGKSWLMQQLISPLLSGFAYYFQGQTTEAGIRQKVGCSTKPVIFDEFETNESRSSERIRTILELARQASSESDAVVAKGTVSGDAMEFRPRFAMLTASVRVNLVHEEDKNRFSVLALARSVEHDRIQRFDRLKRYMTVLTPEYGLRLFSRTLERMPDLLKNCEVFLGVLGARYNMRFGQQYGTMLAGYATLIYDQPITKEQAELLVDSIDFDDSSDEVIETKDEDSCLDALLNKIAEYSSATKTERVTYRELVLMVKESNNLVALKALERNGLSVGDKGLFVFKNQDTLKMGFERTQWAGNYSSPLLRVKGASQPAGARWFSTIKKLRRCVFIPFEAFIDTN